MVVVIFAQVATVEQCRKLVAARRNNPAQVVSTRVFGPAGYNFLAVYTRQPDKGLVVTQCRDSRVLRLFRVCKSPPGQLFVHFELEGIPAQGIRGHSSVIPIPINLQRTLLLYPHIYQISFAFLRLPGKLTKS
jgi:hypothetical protein